MKCVRTLEFRPNENYRSGLKIDKVIRSAWFMNKVCGVTILFHSAHRRQFISVHLFITLSELCCWLDRSHQLWGMYTTFPKTMFTNWITLTESLLFGVCLRVWWWRCWWCYWQRPFSKWNDICLRSIVWCTCLHLKDWTHGLPLNGQACLSSMG